MDFQLIHIIALLVTGVGVGFASGLLGIVGIGDGVVVIPILVMALGFTMHQAVGTSTALMIFTSIGGIISYLFYGLGIEGLPPYSTGYINWLQVLLLAGTAVPMAQVGVKTAHIHPARQGSPRSFTGICRHFLQPRLFRAVKKHPLPTFRKTGPPIYTYYTTSRSVRIVYVQSGRSCTSTP